MAKHSVSYNGIIYVIPNDELYRKYESGEASIDKYGRLIDSKSKKVIKELEHMGDQRPIIQKMLFWYNRLKNILFEMLLSKP